MTFIGSGPIDQMVDTNSAELLSDIAKKRKRWTFFPASVVAAALTTALLVVSPVSLWITITGLSLMILLLLLIDQFDRMNKSLVLMYDLDETSSTGFKCLCDAYQELATCAAIWHISAQAEVFNARYHGGASSLKDRRRTLFGFRDPPYIKTNISVPCLPLGQNSIYLLPDRVLVLTKEGVGAVPYAELRLRVMESRFIEQESVPRDATIVDSTWKFVNTDGSPDRRFRGNRAVPVCQYEELRMTSSSGLEETIQLSRLGASQPFALAITQWASVISVAETTERQRKCPKVDRSMTTPRSQGPDAHETTTDAEAIHRALFEICCTVMIADGTVSDHERETIRNLMSKVNARWSNEEFDVRVEAFIQTVVAQGYTAIVKQSLALVPLFQSTNRRKILLKCIDQVANVDGKLSAREQVLCDQIRDELQ